MLAKINPIRVVSFEVRITISYNSRLVSTNFPCATLDHLINSFGIIPVTNQGALVVSSDSKARRNMMAFREINCVNPLSVELNKRL